MISFNKILPFLVFVFALTSSTVTAQKNDSVPKSGIYEFGLDVDPSPAGGFKAYNKFIREHIRYPKKAADTGAHGTVYIMLIIDTSGSFVAKIKKDPVGFGCAEEALRVIELMPPWQPGMLKGKKVRSRITVPVKFVLK